MVKTARQSVESCLLALCIDKFFSNLFSLLQYGSSIIKGSKNTDYDFLVILENKINPEKDLQILKDFNFHSPNKKIDLQLVYKEEITNPNYFSLDAHGSFFTEILKRAKVLYGPNPFEDMSGENYNVSILSRIQNYIFRARQEMMGVFVERKDSNEMYHQKKIKNIMNDIFIYKGEEIEENFDKCLLKFQNKFKIFNKSEIDRLYKISTNDISNYINYYEKLYSFAIKSIIPHSDLSFYRYKMDKVVSEICVNDKYKDKILILLDGLPSIPKNRDLLQQYSSFGFTVFFPRYPGTWESEGKFLEDNPIPAIEKLLVEIKRGIVVENIKISAKEIYFIYQLRWVSWVIY